MKVKASELKKGDKFRTWMGAEVTVIEMLEPKTCGPRAVRGMRGKTVITAITDQGPYSFSPTEDVDTL